MTYLVTDDKVQGVFSTPALAEEFRQFHNYKNIETWEMDPGIPKRPGLLYRLRRFNGGHKLDRVDSEIGESDWKDFWSGDYIEGTECHFFATTLYGACDIATRKLEELNH